MCRATRLLLSGLNSGLGVKGPRRFSPKGPWGEGPNPKGPWVLLAPFGPLGAL